MNSERLGKRVLVELMHCLALMLLLLLLSLFSVSEGRDLRHEIEAKGRISYVYDGSVHYIPTRLGISSAVLRISNIAYILAF